MKRLIALILTVVILTGCIGVTAYAADNTGGDTEKIIMRIRKPDLSNEDIYALAYEYAGFSEEKKPHYSEDYGAISVMKLLVRFKLYEDEVQRVMTELGIPDERVREISGLTVTADMTAAEVTAAASMTEIESIVSDIEAAVSKKVSPALREVMDSAAEGDRVNLTIVFDEDIKTINDMPSWPYGSKAANELSEFREQHDLILALELLGTEYIRMILHYYYEAPYLAFPYWHYIYTGTGLVCVEKVPVEDIPRIAADSRVKRIELPDETKGDLNYINGLIEPDDFVSVWICCNNTYGRIKSVDEFPSWPDKVAAINEQNVYMKNLQEQYYAEIFPEIDHAIITDYSNLYGGIIAAVKPQDIERLASYPSVKSVEYFDNHMVYPENDIVLPDIVASTSYLYEFDEAYGYNKADYPDYKELCVHRDSNGIVDWVLLKCANASVKDPELWYNDVIGNRVLESAHNAYPFVLGYGIYDVKAEKFVPLTEETAYQYKDLGRVFDQIGEGRLIGDIDRDGELSAVDCTLIQRCATLITEWPSDDVFVSGMLDGVMSYYSDFDRDGDRNIVDATKLQRYVTMIG